MTTAAAILYKLRTSIKKCSPNGIARPLWVSDVQEIIEFIESTEAAYRKQTPMHAVRDSELEASSK